MSTLKKVTVSSLSDKGEGIAFEEGLEIYIPLALPGEEVEVEVGEPFARGSRRCPGTITGIVRPSEQRVVPSCSYFPACGGCQLKHMSTNAQLEHRKDLITQALTSALKAAAGPQDARSAKGMAGAGLSADFTDSDLQGRARELVQPVVSGNSGTCRYKSIRYFACNERSGALEQGFYRARSHELIAIDSCPQEPACFGPLATSLTQVFNSCGMKAWQATAPAAPAAAAGASCASAPAAAPAVAPAAARAAVRALQLRMAQDQVMVLLIVSASPDENTRNALRQWAGQHDEVGSLYLGINDSQGNALFCRQVELLCGKPLLVKELNGISYQIGPQTFMQVNYEMAEALYGRAVEHCVQRAGAGAAQAASVDAAGAASGAAASGAGADHGEDELALDLCCGVGTMTLALSRHFKNVLGVEIVESAIEAAQENAKLNGVDNAHFIPADINKALPGLLTRDSRSRVRAVIADPARAGLGEICARQTGKIPGPCALSLIFCSLTAMKRDLPVLLKSGFTLQSVQGFDMFPDTTHVETLCLLTKKG